MASGWKSELRNTAEGGHVALPYKPAIWLIIRPVLSIQHEYRTSLFMDGRRLEIERSTRTQPSQAHRNIRSIAHLPP